MEAKELFTFALNLPEPWFVGDAAFLTSEFDGEPELHSDREAFFHVLWRGARKA